MVGDYILFIKSGCPYCDKAMDLLQRRELPFKVINFVCKPETAASITGENLLSGLKAAFSHSTVPMILKEEEDSCFKLIGGYTQLVEHLDVG